MDRQGRRGESSKSRASVRSNHHQVSDAHGGQGPMLAWGNNSSQPPVSHTSQKEGSNASELRNKQLMVHNSKFSLKDQVKNTPGGIGGSKMQLKHHYTQQTGQ